MFIWGYFMTPAGETQFMEYDSSVQLVGGDCNEQFVEVRLQIARLKLMEYRTCPR